MKDLKVIMLWSLPVLLPLLAVQAWELYRYHSPPSILSERMENGTYKPVEEFSLTAQNGNTFQSEVLDGQFYVANFFFVSCPDVCPGMNNEMERLYEKFGELSNFSLLSFSVNPEKDTPEKLARYAENRGAHFPDWVFLTGDKRTIYRLARNSYKVSAAEGSGGHSGFIHSELMILVDDNGLLRGFYESSDKRDMQRLRKDIELLLEPA